MKFYKYLFLTITLLLGSFILIGNVNALEIVSNNAILYNLNDDTILYEKNKDQKVSIASLTKVMTALVAIEHIDNLNEKVTFVKSDYDKLIEMDASGSSLDINRSYTYLELLHGLLMESGADCANALARLTLGSEKNFVKEMNQKAKELGMYNTSFANPIGMDDKNNYSTMSDYAILFKTALNNETLKKIMTTYRYKLSDGKTIHHTIYGYLKTYDVEAPYIKGGKTGFETDAGFALASIANYNDVNLMLITTRAFKNGYNVKDAKNIYEYYFKNYSYKKIITKGQILTTINTKNSIPTNDIVIKADKDYSYYIENNYSKDDITIVYDGIETVTPNNKYGEKLGDINIFYKEKLICKIPVNLNERLFPSSLVILMAAFFYIIIIVFTIFMVRKIRRNSKF